MVAENPRADRSGVEGADLVAFRRADVEELIAGTVESGTRQTERPDGIEMSVRDVAEVAGQHAADTESHILSFLIIESKVAKGMLHLPIPLL